MSPQGGRAETVADQAAASARTAEAGAPQTTGRFLDFGAGPSGGRNNISSTPTGEVRMPKPGEGRPVPYDDIKHVNDSAVSMDIFESGHGSIDVKGFADGKNGEPLQTFYRPGTANPWVIEYMPESYTGPEVKARTPGELVMKVAAALGVSGRLSVMDAERPKAKGNSAMLYTAKETFNRPAAPKPTAVQAPRSEAFNPKVANGGNLPPRREGELSAMYDIRVAPSDAAAERLLSGYSVAGLRAMARDAGFSPRSGASKADLIQLLMEPRRRYWDSIALR